MAVARVPFSATVDTDEPPERFDPALALAHVASEVAAGGSFEPGTKASAATPWGDVEVEVRGEGVLVARLPRAEVVVPSVMLAIASARLGLARARIEATRTPVQVLDVGRAVLVVPVDDPGVVMDAPTAPPLDGLPGVEADEAIVYVRTQRTPYVRVLGRLWGAAEPLTALGAAAMHLVVNEGVRADYPRTRVVGELIGHDGERAEVSLQLKSVSGRPKVEALFVGGRVSAAGKG